MKNRYSIILLLILTSYIGKAQVKDISFTLSPAAEYTWWDDKSGLEDGTLVGGKLGFGFGEYLELRGVYLQSTGLKTDFKDFGLQNYDGAEFNAQDVALTRWGGEFKANIGTRKLKPYITLGAGVQKIELNEGIDFNQIYAAAGVGMKFNISKRIVFALEAKNTTYMFDAGSKLLSAENQTDFDVNETSFGNKRLYNWSVQRSLQFYLGGRKPGVLSDLDKAYLQKFKGGFKGLQFIIEPGIAYIDFDDNSLLRDTKWLGGYAGLDFNEYIGVRGFYFKATKDNKISIDFDDLSMYGAEFRARLNDGNGVVPFLILGGGYLDPTDDYVPNSNVVVGSPENGAFITGGLGLNIPLGKHVTISGGARAMMTSGDNVADISNIDDIQTSIFYNAGLKFTLGRKAKSPNTVYEESVNNVLQEQQVRNDDKLNKLIKEYQDKADLLEIELKEAYAQRDVEKALGIIEEKKIVGDALQEVKDVEKLQKNQINNKIMEQAKQLDAVKNKNYVVEPKILERVVIVKDKEEKLIKMTPIEFENLIDRIIKGLDEDSLPSNTPTIKGVNNSLETTDKEVDYLKKRIGVIEKLLLEINAKKWINKN